MNSKIDAKELAKDIQSFKDTNVLVIGDIMLDKYIWGSVDRISPEAPVPIVKIEKEVSFPGGAANVASNIASLGGKPFLVSCRGYTDLDKDGIQLMNSLTEKRVQHKYIIVTENWKTIVKTRIVAHNQQVVRIDNENKENKIEGHKVVECVKDILKSNKIGSCVISDYVKNTLTHGTIEEIIHLVKKKNIPVIVDSKRRHWDCFTGSTIITPNINELNAVTGNRKDGELKVDIILDLYNLNYLLVTKGEHGMTLYCIDGNTINFPSLARTVFDVTGAGDTVVATLALSQGAGIDIHLSTFISNVAAGLSVEKFGTSTINLNELSEGLQKNHLMEVNYV